MGTRARWFCFTLILVGFLDWALTTVGVLFCSAQEANPLLSGVLQSNMLVFSVVKLAAVVVVGVVFYKADGMTLQYDGCAGGMTGRFLLSGYLVSMIGLTAIVANNAVVVLGLL